MVNPRSAIEATRESVRKQKEEEDNQLPSAGQMARTQTPDQNENTQQEQTEVQQRNSSEVTGDPRRFSLEQSRQQRLKRQEEKESLPGEFLYEDAIQNSYKLQKLGAEPGDRVVDGKLIREASEEPRGEVVTSQDISSSPTLQQLGAEPGDMIGEDKKLIKSASNAPFRNFLYGAKETTGPIKDFTSYLESVAPLGRITFDFENGLNYVSFDEEFQDETPQGRRELLQQYKEAELEKERETFEPGGGVSRILGNVAGAIDPSILLPAGAGLKALTASGALYGIAAETGSELAETGELPSLQQTAGAGALGGAAGLAGAAVVKAGKRVAERLKETKAPKQAEAEQKDFESQVNAKVAAGENPAKAARQAQEELGLSDRRLEAISKLTGRKAKISSTTDKAKAAIRDDVASDSATVRQKNRAVDKYLGAIHTRAKNISPAIAGKLRNFEAKTHIRTSERLQRVQPFTNLVSRAPSSIKPQLSRQLFNGNFDAARGLIRTYAPDEVNTFDDAINEIKDIGTELNNAGYEGINTGIENYFPRLVKDLDGLRSTLGKEKKTQIDEALKLKAREKNVGVDKLSLEDRTEVIDKVMRGYRPKTIDGGLSFTKPRTIESISPEQLQYYESAENALQSYVRRSVNDVERRKFFGRAGQNATDGTLDPDSSIGRLVDEEVRNNSISAEDEQVLQDILSARFNGGEKGSSSLIQWLRDVGYASTIANPYTALINLDELSRSSAIFGFRNTLTSLFGRKYTNTVDLGLLNASKEFENPERSARFLKTLFDASGFTKLDQLGKNATVNAAIRRWTSKAKTAKGREEIRKKYSAQFQNETEALIKDLQEGNVTENVKVLGFSSLADLQPIARSELPEAYLSSPNGRIFYMLKSFTLKQYDLVRNEVVKEFKDGNKALAAKKAAVLMGYMTASGTGLGAVRDLMLGRDVQPEDLPDRAMWALLSPYGANKYLNERYLSEGNLRGAVQEQLSPATPLIDDLLSVSADVPEYIKGEKEADVYKAISNVPVVGKLVYNWLGGGAELFNERLEDQREED